MKNLIQKPFIMFGIRQIASLLLLCVLSTQGFAQLNPLGDAKTDSFPKVTGYFNYRDPAPKDNHFFVVEEAGKKVDYTITHSVPDDSGKHKDILILWEYLPSPTREAQNTFFRKVLLDALPLLLKEGDKVNIATFAWTDQKNGTETLSLLYPGFTPDTNALANAVKIAKAPGGKGINATHGSELYPAISEGVDLLIPSKDRAKMLIVLSAEYPNIYNPAGDVGIVTAKAMKADVAVYNYRYKLMADKYSLAEMAKNTYGNSFEVNPKTPSSTVAALVDFSGSAIERSLGLNYAVTFKSGSERDGKSHDVLVKAGSETLSLPFHAPSMGFIGWIKANLILFIALVIVFLGAIGVIFYFRGKAKKAEAERLAAEQQKIEDLKSKSQETEEKLRQQKAKLDTIQTQEANRIQSAADAKRKEEAEKEAKILLEEMYANGKQPRLTTVLNEKPLVLALPSHVTTVGRDPGCEIQISDQTISRTQFQIIYQHGTYTLLDLGSTNGTQLNGERVNQSELRHGDQIKAGNAILYFYL